MKTYFADRFLAGNNSRSVLEALEQEQKEYFEKHGSDADINLRLMEQRIKRQKLLQKIKNELFND